MNGTWTNKKKVTIVIYDDSSVATEDPNATTLATTRKNEDLSVRATGRFGAGDPQCAVPQKLSNMPCRAVPPSLYSSTG